MLNFLTYQQTAFLCILTLSFFFFLTEKLRNDVIAMLIVFSLYACNILTSEEALAGFSSEAAIVVAGIFVLGGALSITGFSDALTSLIGRIAGSSYSRIITVTMPGVAILSAVSHHVTTTALMVPITKGIAKERNIPASKLLMPISFAASLGTTMTIIAAPAFLIANSIIKSSGSNGLGVFSIAPIGIVLTLLGTIFVLIFGRFLLPTRVATEDSEEKFRLDQYLTEIIILKNSKLLNKTLEEINLDSSYPLDIIIWMRNGRKLQKNSQQIQVGDVLVVRTTPEEMIAIRSEAGIELHAIHQYGEKSPVNKDAHQFIQAIIDPKSEFIGKTIGDIDIHSRFGAVIVGLWRKKGWIKEEIAKVKLQSGDVLVIEGNEESIKKVSSDPAFLMLIPFKSQSKLKRKASIAAGIMGISILAAAFNLLSIEMAAIAGALLVVLTGCITVPQAYQSIDTRIYIFIAGAIPLGNAMQKTGISEMIANALKSGVQGWPSFWVLLSLFLIVAVITQFMSDSATTALLGPVAASLALSLGHKPEAYVVTVAMASVASFITPIGHHGNMLVYNPGGYQFYDFVKVGTPLTLFVAVVTAVMTPLVFGI